MNAMKEPSLPICLSCQIERNLDPKEPFFTTLGVRVKAGAQHRRNEGKNQREIHNKKL